MWGAIIGALATAFAGNRAARQATQAQAGSVPGYNPGSVGPNSQTQETQSLPEMVKEAAKTSVASAIGSSIGNRVGGLLTDEKGDAKRSGQAQAAYLKHAYPGSTPWDQLSGSSSSAGSVAQVDKTLATQTKIARINANAKIRSAEIGARGVPSIISQRLAQTLTEKERRKKLIEETGVSKLEREKRFIELKYVEKLQKADLSYQQSRNLLQQWRQATESVMTDKQVSLISAAAQTLGAGAITAYVTKKLASKVPAARIMRGIVNLIPKSKRLKFMNALKSIRKKKYDH